MDKLAYYLIILLASHTGYSLECYKCEPDTNVACNDPFENNAMAHDCGKEETQCIKIDGEYNGVNLVWRMCGQDLANYLPFTRDGNSDEITYRAYYCDEKLCNGSTRQLSISAANLMLPICFTFIYSRLSRA
ncbi:uncharacterized protein [Periplaneta americana]|uniref:uncharacterized protein n=1 Tax=Periplaneta americana TaxID=6978 RepID=UPI0037E93F88